MQQQLHESDIAPTIIGLAIFGIVLFFIMHWIKNTNKRLIKTGDNLLQYLRDQGVTTAESLPYFFLVPKLTPKMLGILVVEKSEIVICLLDKSIQKIALSDTTSVQFPRDVLYDSIRITKSDGVVIDVKFGQDPGLIVPLQRPISGLINVQTTNERFRSYLEANGVHCI